MSEISRSEPMERLMPKDEEGGADWGVLEKMPSFEKKAEKGKEDAAEKSVETKEDSKAEKAESTAEEAETETTEGKVGKLRGWIDLEGIAKAENPEGLEVMERESEARRGRMEKNQAELAEKEGRSAEIEMRRWKELPQELAAAKAALADFERKNGRGMFAGMKKALGVGAKKRAELAGKLAELEAEGEALREEAYALDDETRDLGETIAATDVDGPKREFLEKFETPLTPEEKMENLDFAALAELSTEEYLRLWRRLNPFFVTHVTRQGIRDHNGMFSHSAGMGELHNGMTGILADEKILRTPAEVRMGLGQEITEENVAGALEEMLFNTDVDIEAMRANGMSDGTILDDLVNGLPVNHTMAWADPWADPRAVHFAQQTALDDYYGAETGNEAFFVFPTDVIASQCRFGGHTRGNFTTAQVESERKWNDLFVWPEGKEITIDAGLTFLPKSEMVDAETGSKYATKIVERDGKEVRVPEVDEEAVAKFTEWISGLTAEDAGVKAAMDYDFGPLKEDAKRAGVSERIIDEVAEGNFKYDLMRFVEGGDLAELWEMPEEELAAMTTEERRAQSVRKFLDGCAATWKLPETVVPAGEYWEKYFAEHPEQRPAHVIYYDGDPSAAVVETLKAAGILTEAPRSGWGDNSDAQQRFTGRGDSHERDGGWLGFDENHVENDGTDEAIQAGHKKFNEIARRMIAERYGLGDSGEAL